MTKLNCGVRNLVVECQFHNFKVQNSFPKCGCELRDFHWPQIQGKYWCSSQEAESREISTSCTVD